LPNLYNHLTFQQSKKIAETIEKALSVGGNFELTLKWVKGKLAYIEVANSERIDTLSKDIERKDE